MAALVPRTRPNHCYPIRHPEKVEVIEKEEGENGCPFAAITA